MKKTLFFKRSISCLLIVVMLSFSPISVLGSSIQMTLNTKISENLRLISNLYESDEHIKVGIFLNNLTEEEVGIAFENNSLLSLCNYSIKDINQLKQMSSMQLHNNIVASRKAYSSLYSHHNSFLINKLSIASNVVYVSHYSPLVIATLTKSNISRLALSNYVDYIDIYPNDLESNTVNVSSADELVMDICRIDEAKEEFNVDGSGVIVGVVDSGIPSNAELNEASIEYTASHLYGTYTSGHAIHCAKIIHNVAPGAEFYFAGGNVDGGIVECIEWVLDQEAMVISISLSVGNQYNTYTSYSKWMDHITYQHNAIIVAASGNRDTENEPLGCKDMQMAYGIITVGALNCKNTLSYNDDIHDISQYNPTSNGPFKPDICGAYGDTSSSTALISGSIALLLENNHFFRMCSFTIKALLAASVNKLSPHKYCTANRTDENTSYMQVGSGLLDVYRFLYNGIQENYYYQIVNDSTVQDVITLAPNCNIRLAFAYIQPVLVSSSDHSFTPSSVSGDIVNYAIFIIKQGEYTPIASSVTANNLEIVEFNSGTGGNFTIRIVPVTGSTLDTFYSVAVDAILSS